MRLRDFSLNTWLVFIGIIFAIFITFWLMDKNMPTGAECDNTQYSTQSC